MAFDKKAYMREYRPRYRQEHPEKNRDYQRKREQERRDLFADIKTKAGCARCGYKDNPYGLEFHHRDPSEKSFPIAHGSKRSLKAILAEIAKCDVLCGTCHSIVTHDPEVR